MKSKKSLKMRVFGLVLLPLLAFLGQAGGCVFVEATCLEGEVACSGDYVEQCIDGDWVTIEDCFFVCGGECAFLNDEPVCVCPG
jgi:hypothetical protein